MTAALLDHYLWAAVLGLSVLAFCFEWVRPRFGLAASLLLGAVSCSSIWAWAYVNNRYLGVNPYDQMAIRYFAADSLLKAFLLLVPLMVLSGNRMRMRLLGEVLCSLFLVGNSLYVIAQSFKGCADNACGGLIGNPSVSMGFMACLLPVVVRDWRYQWWTVVLAAVAITLSGSSVGLGLLGVYLAIELLRNRGRAALWLSGGALASCLGIGRLAFGSELTNDSDRFMIWKYMLRAWSAPGNILTGTGFGTYHVFSINLQHMDGRGIAGQQWWNTMHNDWLQMLFECGAVGLLCFLATYCAALSKLWREREFQFVAALVLFGIYMALDPALHDPIPALFGAWAFVFALRRENTLKEYP